MKSKLIISGIFALVLLIAGCEYDNYEPPQSILKGLVIYNGNPVGVRSNGTQLEIWQYGFQLRSKINVYIDQDGKFSARLFDGNYKIVRLSGAPWENQSDSIDVTVKGNTNIDIPVTPYFTLTNPVVTYDGTTKTISATFNVTKIGNKAIERVSLYIGTTTILDASNNAALANKTTGLSDLSVPITVTSSALSTTLAARDYVFVRVGVKATGIAELYYSIVQEIKLK